MGPEGLAAPEPEGDIRLRSSLHSLASGLASPERGRLREVLRKANSWTYHQEQNRHLCREREATWSSRNRSERTGTRVPPRHRTGKRLPVPLRSERRGRAQSGQRGRVRRPRRPRPMRAWKPGAARRRRRSCPDLPGSERDDRPPNRPPGPGRRPKRWNPPLPRWRPPSRNRPLLWKSHPKSKPGQPRLPPSGDAGPSGNLLRSPRRLRRRPRHPRVGGRRKRPCSQPLSLLLRRSRRREGPPRSRTGPPGGADRDGVVPVHAQGRAVNSIGRARLPTRDPQATGRSGKSLLRARPRPSRRSSPKRGLKTGPANSWARGSCPCSPCPLCPKPRRIPSI